MTLKTLENIHETTANEMHVNFARYAPIVINLRQEAIAWIKSDELNSAKEDMYIRRWIRHFFNIKERDLK